MAKQRDTMASLRKRITQLETTIDSMQKTINTNYQAITFLSGEKAILVKTIAKLTDVEL